MELLYLCFKKSSKLSLTPNYSSAYVSTPILMIERRFSVFLAFGDLTTIMKSYSAFGPSFKVILLVNSLEIGFSMYQDSCLISLFTIVSDFLPEQSKASGSILKGNSGFPNLSKIFFLLY